MYRESVVVVTSNVFRMSSVFRVIVASRVFRVVSWDMGRLRGLRDLESIRDRVVHGYVECHDFQACFCAD